MAESHKVRLQFYGGSFPIGVVLWRRLDKQSRIQWKTKRPSVRKCILCYIAERSDVQGNVVCSTRHTVDGSVVCLFEGIWLDY